MGVQFGPSGDFSRTSTMWRGPRRLNTTTQTTTRYERTPLSEVYGRAVAFCGFRPVRDVWDGPGYDYNDHNHHHHGRAPGPGKVRGYRFEYSSGSRCPFGSRPGR